MADYRVLIDNSDRNTHYVRYFNILFDANKFANDYPMKPGDELLVVQISDDTVVSSKEK